MTNKEIIARRVARELKDGDVVNLGIGLPTLVANFVDPSLDLVLQSENGFVGIGPAPEPGRENSCIVNAGGIPATIRPGGAFFDSCLSFAMIRGGHVDLTVLGALQVDAEGSIANWVIPGVLVPGMGGAMDLAVGAKRVIVAMEHTAKGEPRILERCTLPLTAKSRVEMIVTEMGVMTVTPGGLLLTEIHPNCTLERIQKATETRLHVSNELKPMRI